MTSRLNQAESNAPAVTTGYGGRPTGVGGAPAERQTMTITELARTLGISRTTCYELAQRHGLPVRVVRVGRRLLVSKVEVARFLEGNIVDASDSGRSPVSR